MRVYNFGFIVEIGQRIVHRHGYGIENGLSIGKRNRKKLGPGSEKVKWSNCIINVIMDEDMISEFCLLPS